MMSGARDHLPAESSPSHSQERGPVRDPSEKLGGAGQTGERHLTPNSQLSCQNPEPGSVSFGVQGGESSWKK